MSDPVRSSQDDWDAHWASYADSAESNPAQRMRQDLIVQLLCEEAGSSEARVFDIGSGQGDLLRQPRPLRLKAKLLGAELSARGVAISQRKVPEAMLIVTVPGGPVSAFDRHIGHRQHFDPENPRDARAGRLRTRTSLPGWLSLF